MITRILFCLSWSIISLAQGQGFGPQMTPFPTPIGGFYNSSGTNLGYLSLNCTNAQNPQSEYWTLVDMDGDGKKDLVVPSAYESSVNYAMQFGAATNPHWKVYLNSGSEFSTTATIWSTPIGGFYSNSGVNFGYFKVSDGGGTYTNNSEIWSLFDINGDARPDLVVAASYLNSNASYRQFGLDSTPYWKVYLNNGNGFSNTVTTWPSPSGGYFNSSGVQFGYNNFGNSGTSNLNSESWAIADMNGDALPDLVVPSQFQPSVNWALQFGASTAPYWKVYLNTGNGFSTNASNFTTPIGGYYNSSGVNYGYNQLFGSAPSNNNSENWALTDMNGDGLPDIVVPSDYQTANGGERQFGIDATPFWKVYLNSGVDFSTSPVQWITPTGGFYNQNGTNLGFLRLNSSNASYANCQNWNLSDINGDLKPDLIVHSQFETVSNSIMQYGAGTAPQWRVFLNSGNEFSTWFTPWTTPVGGFYDATGINQGYVSLSYTNPSYPNCEEWGVTDINGDDRADLVVVSMYEASTSTYAQFGAGSSPYWKVFLNTENTVSIPPDTAASMILYPNPSFNTIRIQTAYSGQLRIYSTLGTCVYSNPQIQRDWLLDVSKWPSGMYWIECSGAAQRKTAVLMKN